MKELQKTCPAVRGDERRALDQIVAQTRWMQGLFLKHYCRLTMNAGSASALAEHLLSVHGHHPS